MKELDLSDFELQNIKDDAITDAQLDNMKAMTGSYESLFSKRSQQYKALGLKDKILTESDYKKYILQHYSFLKRPVFIVENNIFVGNDKKVIEELRTFLA
jgi:arsenate reductase